jgi:putative PIG3 family NAD(P)H quinone oxidoreductase
MELATSPTPLPRPGEVLIEVEYAGVNRPDVLQRAGGYPPPPDASPILGLEVAGRVVACGEGVTAWRPGDTVCALTPGGGYAEYCTTPAGYCLPLPAGLGTREAASLPETFFTVWNNVFDRGRLAPGESLLVHGGSSGIGITAIQLAKAFGAVVYATVGGPAKADACRALGADHVIDYRSQDFVAEILRLTDRRGVDVILDMVGGDYVPRNLRALATDGRLLLIGFMKGSTSAVDWRSFIVRRQTITGSTLRASPPSRKFEIASALAARVWPLLASGRVKPLIHRVFGLAEAAQAHRLMESSEHIGKILLAVRGEV